VEEALAVLVGEDVTGVVAVREQRISTGLRRQHPHLVPHHTHTTAKRNKKGAENEGVRKSFLVDVFGDEKM
jgi:hypothetical protein